MSISHKSIYFSTKTKAKNRKSWIACFESHFICNTVLQNVFLGDFTNGNASFFHLVPLFPIGSKDPVFLAIVDMPCNERSTQDRSASFYHQSKGLCRRWVEANLRIRQCWWRIKWWELWTRSRLSWLNIKSRLVERWTLSTRFYISHRTKCADH